MVVHSLQYARVSTFLVVENGTRERTAGWSSAEGQGKRQDDVSAQRLQAQTEGERLLYEQSLMSLGPEVLEVERRGSAPKTCTIITRGKAKESWAGVMALSMLRTRPRLQTNALQGTAGQGRGSGAQKGDCCCEECGDGGGACSRTPPPSPVVHQTCTGDVTRAGQRQRCEATGILLARLPIIKTPMAPSRTTTTRPA